MHFFGIQFSKYIKLQHVLAFCVSIWIAPKPLTNLRAYLQKICFIKVKLSCHEYCSLLCWLKNPIHKVLGNIKMNETILLFHFNYKIEKPDRYTHSPRIVINVSNVLRRLRKDTEKHAWLSEEERKVWSGKAPQDKQCLGSACRTERQRGAKTLEVEKIGCLLKSLYLVTNTNSRERVTFRMKNIIFKSRIKWVSEINQNQGIEDHRNLFTLTLLSHCRPTVSAPLTRE